MASLIQKAAGGNRAALEALYEANKGAVYGLSYGLVRNTQIAAAAAGQALQSAMQMIFAGTVRTEQAFAEFALKQAASHCKTEVLKHQPKAFMIPPKKDFHIRAIPEDQIGRYAGPLENYLNLLPTFQRFVLVLRHMGGLSVLDISSCMALEPSVIERALEAEQDNLSRIYRAVKAVGGQCTPPTSEMLKIAFQNKILAETVPEAVDRQISAYLDSVSAFAGQRNKRKRCILAAAAAILCVAALIYLLVPRQEPTTELSVVETTFATEEATQPPETEYTQPFNIAPTESRETEVTTTYFADITIENHGTITVELDADAAPITVENFVSLAESGFYDGLTFHRIMEGFMMQGGDPNGDGTGGSEKTIKGEFTENGVKNSLSHTRGAISMARSNDYNSASSQFFIVHEDSTFLDGQYAVFGYVTEGMEIVDAICTAAEPTDDNGTILPEDQPVITSIRIRTETAGGEIIAQVKEVRTDGTLLLHLYALESSAADYRITDYAAVELDNYAYAFDTMEYTLKENAVIKIAKDGTLTDANALALSAKDMVIINSAENIIIVYQNHFS